MANFCVRHLPGANATSARCRLPAGLALRSRVTQDSKNSPIECFMTNFHLGCSIRTQKRHRSGLPLTNYDPRGTFGENKKIISPIAYFMANLGGKSAIHNPQPGHCRMLICEVQARLLAAGHAANDFCQSDSSWLTFPTIPLPHLSGDLTIS